MQTNKFVLIHATAMTLGQGHGKVIQYILPDLYGSGHETAAVLLPGFAINW